MTNMDSIFSSDSSEQRWVSLMTTTVSKEHVKDTNDIPACVFHVPKTVRNEKPEAYSPQKLGLGPYHHLRPDLYKSQRVKLAAVKRQLNPEQFNHFNTLFIDKFKHLDSMIRVFYDNYLDMDCDTLAWVMTIDGLFLFDLISRKYDIHLHLGDVMMLENQLPLFVLKEIKEGLTGSIDDSNGLYYMLRKLCEAHSPLELTEQNKFQYISRLHLLDYMYHLIVENRGMHYSVTKVPSSGVKQRQMARKPRMGDRRLEHKVNRIATIAIKEWVNDASRKILTFVKALPWDMILSFFKKQDNSDYEEKGNINNVVVKIGIPSASCLEKTAKVNFQSTEGGIRDVKYDNENQAFYLPVITLDKYSEVILRNLVAYEEAIIPKQYPSWSFELGDYVDLMCGLINTAEDAKTLREKRIIRGDLRDDEIACLCNGISKSRGKAKINSNYWEVIEELNELYDNMWRVKADRFIKKVVYASRKFLTLFAGILLMLLLILQSFCQIFGCSRFFGSQHMSFF